MIGKDIKHAAELLSHGQLVAIPTETVYGLAGNALMEEAVTEIFRVKNRPSFDPLIMHVGHPVQLEGLVKEWPDEARELADAFWPGPLTLLLPKTDRVSDLITAGSPRVAVRIPSHPLTLELLQYIDFPVVAPSANPFGYISPTRPDHVDAQLGSRLPYILDGGACAVGIESTIVGFDQGNAVIYRKGGLSLEKIEEQIGPVQVRAHSTSNPQAPGMLKSHYAPRIPLEIVDLDKLEIEALPENIGVISFQKELENVPADRQIILSESGDYAEAAQRLFAALRYLDSLPLVRIYAGLLPEEDLGRAINDRLRRAAAPQE